MAWAVAEGDHARRADDTEPAIDREAAARLRGVHRACASIASAVCLTKLRVPIPAAHSASAYLVRVRVGVRVRVRVQVRVRVRVSASSYLIVRRKLQWGAGLLACAQRAAGLQLSCCAPGSSPAYYRCAGWMGLCPAGPAQGAPPPASPAPTLPIPARHGPSFRFAPLTLSQSHNSTHIMLCAQIRGGLDESF